jgi:hypothetical protein
MTMVVITSKVMLTISVPVVVEQNTYIRISIYDRPTLQIGPYKWHHLLSTHFSFIGQPWNAHLNEHRMAHWVRVNAGSIHVRPKEVCVFTVTPRPSTAIYTGDLSVHSSHSLTCSKRVKFIHKPLKFHQTTSKIQKAADLHRAYVVR